MEKVSMKEIFEQLKDDMIRNLVESSPKPKNGEQAYCIYCGDEGIFEVCPTCKSNSFIVC